MRQEIQCTPAAAVQLFTAQLLSEPAAAGARTGHWSDDAKRALTQHWPEFMIEGFCLGAFMISACTFTALLEHPASPVRTSVANADLRRFLGGIAMGLTAVLLIYSPYGRRSGAHMNPATTLILADRNVNFAITRPGMRGIEMAFLAEAVITFLLMTVILNVSNNRKYARFTGMTAGMLVMLFI